MISLVKKYVTIVSSVVIVAGSMFTNTTSYAASGDTTVYITKTGECYHRDGCSSLRKSKTATTMQKAVLQLFPLMQSFL